MCNDGKMVSDLAVSRVVREVSHLNCKLLRLSSK